jgi:hypothetical protein
MLDGPGLGLAVNDSKQGSGCIAGHFVIGFGIG